MADLRRQNAQWLTALSLLFVLGVVVLVLAAVQVAITDRVAGEGFPVVPAIAGRP